MKNYVLITFILLLLGGGFMTTKTECSQLPSLAPGALSKPISDLCNKGIIFATQNPLSALGLAAAGYFGWGTLRGPIKQLHHKLKNNFPMLYGKSFFISHVVTAALLSTTLGAFLSYQGAVNTLAPGLQSSTQNYLGLIFSGLLFNYAFSPITIAETVQGTTQNSTATDEKNSQKDADFFTAAPNNKLEETEAKLLYGSHMNEALEKMKRDEALKEKSRGFQCILYGEAGNGKTEFVKTIQRIKNSPMICVKAAKSRFFRTHTVVGKEVDGVIDFQNLVDEYYQIYGRKLIVFVDEADNVLRKTDGNDIHTTISLSLNKSFMDFQEHCRDLGIHLFTATNLDLKLANETIVQRVEREQTSVVGGEGLVIKLQRPELPARIAMLNEIISQTVKTKTFNNVIIPHKAGLATYIAQKTEGFMAYELANAVKQIFALLRENVERPLKLEAAEANPMKALIEPTIFIDLDNPTCMRIIDQALGTSSMNSDPQKAFAHWKDIIGDYLGIYKNLTSSKKETKINELKSLVARPSQTKEAPGALFQAVHPYWKKIKDLKANIKELKRQHDSVIGLEHERKGLKTKQKKHRKKFKEVVSLYKILGKLSEENFETFAKKYAATETKLQKNTQEAAQYSRIALALTQLKEAQESRKWLLPKLKPRQLLIKATEYASQFTSDEDSSINAESKGLNKNEFFPLGTIFVPDRNNTEEGLSWWDEKKQAISNMGQSLMDHLFCQEYEEIKVGGAQRVFRIPGKNFFPFLFKIKHDKTTLYRLLGLRHTESHGILGAAANLLLSVLGPFYNIYEQRTKAPDRSPFGSISDKLKPFIPNKLIRHEKIDKILKSISSSNPSVHTFDQKIAEAILKQLGQPTTNLTVSRNDNDELVINGKTTTELKKEFDKLKQLRQSIVAE